MTLTAAMAFACAVADSRRETAVSALLEGISSLSAADDLDGLESRTAWAPAYLWGRKEGGARCVRRSELETAGFSGFSAALIAAEVLALGRARIGDASGPVEARHIKTTDAILVAVAAAKEAHNLPVEMALSIVLEAIDTGDERRLADFFTETDVSAVTN